MNWGYKILIVYCVFIAGIIFMVYQSSNQKMDLVTEDYYGKELKYQSQIDETVRANALSQDVSYAIKNDVLLLHFPKDFAGKKISGTAQLYCPSNKDNDITKKFTVADTTAVQIQISNNTKGLYELHINWQVDGTAYYFEKKIII